MTISFSVFGSNFDKPNRNLKILTDRKALKGCHNTLNNLVHKQSVDCYLLTFTAYDLYVYDLYPALLCYADS